MKTWTDDRCAANRNCDIGRQWNLYAESVPLFWRHRTRIVADMRLFWVSTPVRVGMVGLWPSASMACPLGVMVRAWSEYGDVYTAACPECGGLMLLYSFAGSPLSGRSRHSKVCVVCGYRQTHVDDGMFGRLVAPIVHIANRNGGLPPCDVPSLDEVVGHLAGLE